MDMKAILCGIICGLVSSSVFLWINLYHFMKSLHSFRESTQEALAKLSQEIADKDIKERGK